MNIKDAAKAVLTQLEEVVRQLDDETYRQPIQRLGNASLGQHIRHTLEFFDCLFAGIDQGVVNYDDRRRDVQIETSTDFALTSIQQLEYSLDRMDLKRRLILIVDYGIEGANPQEVETNAGRELSYNIEHAVHHMAIFKVGLAEVAPQVRMPEGFGIAVSTLKHMKEVAESQG